MKEGISLLEHLNLFDMLNSQLVGFRVKLEEEEDKDSLLLVLLPYSYYHLVTMLLYMKETATPFPTP